MRRTLFALAVVAAVLPVSARAQDVAIASPSNLSLFPGDAVKIQIWQEPDLSGTFRVGEDSKLTLPLLGARSVEGISADQLRQQLVADYSRELKNPSIEISVLRRVSVLGEVKSPGLYDLDPAMRLGDAIALAGGVTEQGNAKDVEIRRDDVEIADGLGLGTVIGDRVRSGDQIVVDKTSWFSRNSGMVVGIAATVTGILLRGFVFN